MESRGSVDMCLVCYFSCTVVIWVERHIETALCRLDTLLVRNLCAEIDRSAAGVRMPAALVRPSQLSMKM